MIQFTTSLARLQENERREENSPDRENERSGVGSLQEPQPNDIARDTENS
jgi:hypothetical protein